MAAKVFQGGVSGGNWNANGNWVGGAFAIAGDTVTFLSNSNPCIINVTSACTSIDFTGWSGNLTMTGALTLSGDLKFSATMTISGAANITINASSTITSNGIVWPNNITFSASSTITINTLLTVSGIITLGSAATITFAGTHGFTCGTLMSNTFVNGVIYTITTAINAMLTRVGAIITFTSDHATNKAILVLNWGAAQNVIASFIRIDSSAGQPINTFNGTITTCFNINSITNMGSNIQWNAPVLEANLPFNHLKRNNRRSIIRH